MVTGAAGQLKECAGGLLSLTLLKYKFISAWGRGVSSDTHQQKSTSEFIHHL
jgi:hypothetical protein